MSAAPLAPEALTARTLAGYLWGSRDRLWRGFGLSLLRSLAVAPCAWLFQRMIDVAVPARDTFAILQLSGWFLLLLALHYVFSVWGAHVTAQAMAQMMVEMRSRIFFKLQFLSFGYLDQQKTGRLLAKYAFDTQKVEALLYNILNQFLPNVLYGMSIFIILTILNWRLALVLGLIIPAYALAKYYFFARIQYSNHAARLAQEHLTGTASEYISALRLVRSFGEEKQAEADLDRSSLDFARQRIHQMLPQDGFLHLPEKFLEFSRDSGTSYLPQNQRRFGAFFNRYSILRVSGEDPFRFCSFRPTQINLSIKPGEHVALVGPSGSGKSTLANLLLGLYAASRGQIFIDGVPQSEWDMRWVRRQLAVVLQDSLLLSGTISDNLRFARADATDDELRQAAQQANAEEFILRLPNGYATAVGERGVTLSGGQRQRLAIARAILRNPPVLILDEATSALDYQSERLIQEALDRLAAGRTVITIAHRLSTIRNASRIIVLEAGRIIEEGDFRTLVARGGPFARMVATQNTVDDFLQL